ncbi:MAG: beta-ketoacyl synthase [Flavobacteriales bacterium]|nr:beta-ketoacyl synthase [Flavobacteriales bacterium]
MADSRNVYVTHWNVFTPLGKNTGEVFENMQRGESSCMQGTDPELFPEPFCASRFMDYSIQHDGFSRLEDFILRCLSPILSKETAVSDRTVLIFSSTKGNIDLLNPDASQPINLWETARKISAYFENPNRPLTVSNACVSGIMAQNLGADLIRCGRYDHAVVFGADILTAFVMSGFGCFKAMSPEPCKPYDAARIGINLGEGAGAVILSSAPGNENIRITGGGSGNDANHISGPSRTGEGLSIAIKEALHEAECSAETIDFISAHGTATSYNDEMESLAFTDCGLSSAPLHSLKGYLGHTLGAAGLIETAILLESMKRGILLPSAGYTEHGVTGAITVQREVRQKPIRKALKTGSGFGGCNAATVFEKA